MPRPRKRNQPLNNGVEMVLRKVCEHANARNGGTAGINCRILDSRINKFKKVYAERVRLMIAKVVGSD